MALISAVVFHLKVPPRTSSPFWMLVEKHIVEQTADLVIRL
jgi:hypothetical protein